MSGLAVVNAGIAVIVLVIAAQQITSAPGGRIERLLLAGLFVAVGTCMFVGSWMAWLSARPHADPTMRRWRTRYFAVCGIAMCIAGFLWILR
jgi:uncharacterized membrane protein YidH (DUF202 family)